MAQNGTLSFAQSALSTVAAPAVTAPAPVVVDSTAFYVSPDGNDLWSGKLSAPNATKTDGPLATLAAAQKKMQGSTIKKTYVRGGTYSLPATLALGSMDNGVTFEGFPGETAVVRGGKPITGWQQDPTTGLWSAPVAATSMPGGKLDALYVDGVALTRARYPNAVPSDPVKGGWLFADTATAGMNTYSQFRFRPGDIPQNIAVTGLRVNIWDYNGWQNYNADVASVDFATGIVTLKSSPGGSFNTGSRYFLYNAKDQVDAPGEFYYDAVVGKVTVKAPSTGFDPNKVAAGTVETVFSAYAANNVTIKNLTIGDTTSTGKAFTINNSTGFTVSGNVVRNVDLGVSAMGTSSNLVVTGNQFGFVGSSAVRVDPSTSSTTISANWIHDVGLRQLDGTAVWIAGSSGNVVRNNLFERMGKFAVGGGSTTAAPASYNNLVELNSIRNANRNAADGGAIMFAGVKGELANGVIRYNDIAGTSAAGTVIGYSNQVNLAFFDPTKLTSFAVYLDDYASGYSVTGNVIHDNLGGVLVHGGRYNAVRGNIFANNRGDAFNANESVWMNLPMPAATNNDVTSNVVYLSTAEHKAFNLSGARAMINPNSNLFGGANAGAADIFKAWPKLMSTGWTGGLAQWKAAGLDVASVSADPLFTNLAGGDYSLAASSPAYGIGYVAIPTSQIGLVPALRTPATASAP
jgi:parallel beta-helix repeat protein